MRETCGRGSPLVQMSLAPQDRVRTGSGKPRVGKPRVRLTTGPPASTLQIGTPRVNTAIAGNNHRRGYSRAQEWVHPNSVLPRIGICLAAVYPLAPVTP